MGLLEGRCAVVTGGGSGIGLAAVRRLAGEGARVAVVDIDLDAAGRSAADVDGVPIGCDVADSAQVAGAFAAAERELGSVDIAFLNAGVTTGQADITQLTDEQYRRIAGINMDGVVFGMREAARTMVRAGGGAIVATASIAGIIAYSGDPIYALTKHAVVGLVRGVAQQLEARQITVNAVCPGIVETPLVGQAAADGLKRAGFPLIQPSEVAEAVVQAITSGQTGQAYVVQPGRGAEQYAFRGVPGPRTPGAEGMAPPGMRR